jgi:GAF domain-containing protein
MLRFLSELFESPEDQSPNFIALVRNILLIVLFANFGGLILVSGLLGPQSYNPSAILSLSVTLVLELIALVRARRGRLGMAKIVVPLALTVAITIIAFATTGIHSIAALTFPLIVVVSTLMLGEKASYTSTPLVILAVVVLTISDLIGVTDSVFAGETGVEDVFLTAMLIYATHAVLQLLIQRLNQNLQLARANEAQQARVNREMQELRAVLEQRVEERTSELSQVNQRYQRRARQFEAIAQVARTAAAIQTLDELLNRITQLISDQFGYYHVGVFMLDQNKEYAVLRAANSDGGLRMLQRGHSLRVGETGIVGYVSDTGIPRIAMDVEIDQTFFNNPDLPGTRSEMALPLRLGIEIIGVLDVQSTEPNAFTQEDSQVLSTLADQVAIAIQNVRSIATTQQLLAESQRVASGYVQNAWQILKSGQQRIGYHFSATSLKQLEQPLESPQIQQTLNKGEVVIASGTRASLTVPIRLRGEVIGVMELRAPQGHAWTQDEADIAEAVSERLSLAIETATVIESTQRRAALEQATSEMSSKIGTSTQIETILRTTAEELSRAFGGSEVLVQIQPQSADGLRTVGGS